MPTSSLPTSPYEMPVFFTRRSSTVRHNELTSSRSEQNPILEKRKSGFDLWLGDVKGEVVVARTWFVPVLGCICPRRPRRISPTRSKGETTLHLNSTDDRVVNIPPLAYLVNVLRGEVDLQRQDADVLRPSSPVFAASVLMKVVVHGVLLVIWILSLSISPSSLWTLSGVSSRGTVTQRHVGRKVATAEVRR